ncbi:hypothetical protein ILUMI_24034, partial [Ignelater luminosus]
ELRLCSKKKAAVQLKSRGNTHTTLNAPVLVPVSVQHPWCMEAASTMLSVDIVKKARRDASSEVTEAESCNEEDKAQKINAMGVEEENGNLGSLIFTPVRSQTRKPCEDSNSSGSGNKIKSQPIETRNRYEVLSEVEDNDYNSENESGMKIEASEGVEDGKQNRSKKEKPPPPVVLHGYTVNHSELSKIIGKTATKGYSMKYTRNNINIFIKDKSERKTFIDRIKEQSKQTSGPELCNISEQSDLASSSNQQPSTSSTSNLISPSTPGTPARKTNLMTSSQLNEDNDPSSLNQPTYISPFVSWKEQESDEDTSDDFLQLQRKPIEGDFVVVKFHDEKKNSPMRYIAKIPKEQIEVDNFEITIYHKSATDVLLVLSAPEFYGAAKRQILLSVALIFGIAGALRREELYKMTLEDINDTGTVLIITIPDSKTHIQRRFTVIAETTQKDLNLIEIYRKYKAQRLKNVKSNHFFLQFRNGNCKTQVVGINTFSKIPPIVAKYLSLLNPDHYTGHAFRRSSASLLVDSGGDLIQLKKHGGWKSNAVAEGYVDQSIQNKMDCANKIFTGGHSSRNTPNPASFSANNINDNVLSVVEKSININSCNTNGVSVD